MTFILEGQRNKFNSLTESKKNEIISTFENRVWSSPNEAQSIFESCFKKESNAPLYLQLMPAKIKSTWDSLTESQQNVIKGQALTRNLETPYQIDVFWKTRNLSMFERNTKNLDNHLDGRLNESNTTLHLTDRMQSLQNELKHRFNKF
jgi:hypothetical protein